MTIQTEATENCIPVVLFIILYMVVLSSETVDETELNKSYWTVFSWGAVILIRYTRRFSLLGPWIFKSYGHGKKYWSYWEVEVLFLTFCGGPWCCLLFRFENETCHVFNYWPSWERRHGRVFCFLFSGWVFLMPKMLDFSFDLSSRSRSKVSWLLAVNVKFRGIGVDFLESRYSQA